MNPDLVPGLTGPAGSLQPGAANDDTFAQDGVTQSAALQAAGRRASGSLGVFLLVLSIVWVVGPGHPRVQDEVALYYMTAGFLETGHFAVPRDVNTGGGFRGLDGRYYSPFGIGQPALAWPWLATARLLLPRRSPPYLEVALLMGFNALVTAATAALLCHFLTQLGSCRRRAVVLSLISVLATPALAYGRSYFAEPLTGLCGLLAFRAAWQARAGDSRQVVLAGLLAGFAVLVRFFSVLILPVYVLYLLWPDSRPWGRRIQQAAVFSAVAGLFVLASLARNHALLGSWFETGYQLLPTGLPRGFTHPIPRGLAVLLLAPGKSLLIFAAPVLLGFAALAAWGRRRPAEASLIVAVTAVYLIGYAHWCSPEGGYSWGPRFLVPILPLLFLPLADVPWSRRKTVALAMLTGVGLAVSALELPVDSARRMAARADEVYDAQGYYNLGFLPYADHLQEAWRVRGEWAPTPETIGRNRRHLVPDWTGQPDFWFVHLLREGHSPGLLLGVLGGQILVGLLGFRLVLRSLGSRQAG